jgi:RNA polymerase sigma-70 factor (ECF subfamily)
VQDALLRGIANIHRFQPGTNIEAWLMVILRNSFLSQIRAAKHETAHKALMYGEPIAAHPNQLGAVQLRELRQALTKVPQDQREALLLVAGYGYSYDDAARMCGCPAGTIKSRVNRARFHLRKLMQTSCATEFGPDERNVAVVAATLVGTPQLQQFK